MIVNFKAICNEQSDHSIIKAVYRNESERPKVSQIMETECKLKYESKVLQNLSVNYLNSCSVIIFPFKVDLELLENAK